MFIKKYIKKQILEYVHGKNETFRETVLGSNCYHDPQLWGMQINERGHLSTSGCDLEELARLYGTPLHVVDTNRLVQNFKEFHAAFKSWYPRVEIAYSYKTNPLPGVIQVIHELGGYAEVISHFELWMAFELGVPPEKIIFNGPAKTLEALELAVSKNIQMINIDSENEIDIISSLVDKRPQNQKIGVRVVTSVGWAGQFGIPISDGRAFRAYERLSSLQRLDPRGIHIHLGTGIRDITTYCQAIKEVMDFTLELKERLGIELNCIDFGGGFGVPTVQGYSYWDTKLILNGYPPRVIDTKECALPGKYAKEIFSILNNYFSAHPWLNPTIFFEPGRAITSSSQSLMLQVLNVKPATCSSKYVIVDGGKNLAMPLGYEQHAIFPVGKMNEKVSSDLFTVVGPLCYPEDVLIPTGRLPDLCSGDVVAIMDAGAYFIPNQQNFSNPRAAVVMTAGKGVHRLVRAREQFSNMVALDAYVLNENRSNTSVSEL